MKSRPWLQILIIGTILFIITEETLRATRNPNFFPTVLLIGSFLIPVTFVVYFYEHVMHREISLVLLTSCFFIGGILGVITAGIIEYNTLTSLNTPSLVAVGFIEEAVKMIFPAAMYLIWRYRHEADGLLFGIAAGMGFAALETMGYGLVTLIQTGGSVSALQHVLLLRGILSPAGHASWTGFLCAVLWREREKHGRITINLAVIGAYLTAVALHTLWDMVNSIPTITPSQIVTNVGGTMLIAVVSLSLLFWSYRTAKARSPIVPKTKKPTHSDAGI